MPSSEMEISHLNGVNAYNQIDYTCASFARTLNEHWQHTMQRNQYLVTMVQVAWFVRIDACTHAHSNIINCHLPMFR